ncbi:MAG: DUF1801 domain-containing protein [Bacteroidetes bacterium]|nr:DUF1801 domain-containing protein [Bacteroidota bacterium]
MVITPGTKFKSIADYFSVFPPATRKMLKEMQRIIRSVAPEAEEVISYNMPAFKQEGMLVYYAAYKEHIGFYPTGSGIAAFRHEFAKYKWSKGAVQFPLGQPLPVSLIGRIVKFRLKENLARAKEKKQKK